MDDLTGLVKLFRRKPGADKTALGWGLSPKIVERAVTLSKQPAHPGGRPNEKRIKRTQVMLTEDEDERLSRLADEAGLTVSDYIRSKIL